MHAVLACVASCSDNAVHGTCAGRCTRCITCPGLRLGSVSRARTVGKRASQAEGIHTDYVYAYTGMYHNGQRVCEHLHGLRSRRGGRVTSASSHSRSLVGAVTQNGPCALVTELHPQFPGPSQPISSTALAQAARKPLLEPGAACASRGKCGHVR